MASNEGLKYEEIGDWDNAIRLHKEALRINPNNETARLNLAGAINNKGVEYDNRKEYENALKLYEESLRINPNNAVTRKNILLVKSRIVNKKGIEYYEKRDYDSAISRFEEAIKVNPEHQTARDNLKEAKERKKEQGEAETRRLREQRFEAQLEEERLAKQKREEKERLEEQKLKEAKHRVNNMLDSLAKKFDISPPVGASKSSSSSGLSLMGPTTRLFEKGTKGSAPVDLRLIPPDKPVVVHPEDVKGTGPGNYTKEVAKQLNEGDIAGARADAARITGSFEKAWAYQRIARAQAQAGDTAGARETLELARKSAEKVEDSFAKALVYGELDKAELDVNDPAGAQQRRQEETRRQAMQMYLAGEKENISRIENDAERAWAYQSIARAQAKAGDTAGARESLELAKKSAEKVEDSFVKALTYRELGRAEFDVNDPAGAEQRRLEEAQREYTQRAFAEQRQEAARIENDFERAWTYQKMAREQAQAGDTAGARETLELAKKSAEKVEDSFVKALTYRELGRAEFDVNDPAGAQQRRLEEAQREYTQRAFAEQRQEAAR
ncbi:MAG: tetratricopeptide repeat protein, partial [Candidatus Brocadiales bacterium]|nr:tetratricopeptide repeat protein [Candidatus Bathyanammoxibius amoris]